MVRGAWALASVCVILSSSWGWAQPPGVSAETARADLAKFKDWAGRWEGEGWIEMGPQGRRTFRQTEHVQYKLDGVVMEIEGVGWSKDDDTGKEVKAFQALAVLARDPAGKGYAVHAFRDNGLSTVAKAEKTADGLIWTIEPGQGGKVRYTITLKGDRWEEIGEYSRDGQSWNKFLEMKLKKVTAAPAQGG
jgi:hypothetical protein